jgi:hypothetical protein
MVGALERLPCSGGHMGRILYGALAGTAATLAMTVAMRRLHARLPERDRYPLPPREIVGAAAGEAPEAEARTPRPAQALAAHFAYGALTGALFAVGRRRGLLAGGAWGLAVWGLSYLGWIPAVRLLRPATRHPAHRNALMIAAHAVWGTTLAFGLREIEAAAEPVFGTHSGRLPDIRT